MRAIRNLCVAVGFAAAMALPTDAIERVPVLESDYKDVLTGGYVDFDGSPVTLKPPRTIYVEANRDEIWLTPPDVYYHKGRPNTYENVFVYKGRKQALQGWLKDCYTETLKCVVSLITLAVDVDAVKNDRAYADEDFKFVPRCLQTAGRRGECQVSMITTYGPPAESASEPYAGAEGFFVYEVGFGIASFGLFINELKDGRYTTRTRLWTYKAGEPYLSPAWDDPKVRGLSRKCELPSAGRAC